MPTSTEDITTAADLHRLGPQSVILTVFGDYVFHSRRPVWSGGLVQLLESLGFTSASARLALSRLARRGLLDRTKNGRLTYYDLSTPGFDLLAEGQRRIFNFGSDEVADPGVWTIVSYSIPEDRRAVRDKLRKRLSFLGFASLNAGTWFSPRDRDADVRALLADLDLEREGQVFIGQPSPAYEPAELVRRSWDLSALRDRYATFVEDFAPYRAAAARGALSDEEAFVVRTRIMHSFRRFPVLDPELPEELVGEHWQRAEAIDTFHESWNGLAPAATRHFDQITAPTP